MAKAPDGNGGMFLALHKAGLLGVLAEEGECLLYDCVWRIKVCKIILRLEVSDLLSN